MLKTDIGDLAVRAEENNTSLKEEALIEKELIKTDLVASSALKRAIEEGEESGYIEQFDFKAHLDKLINS